MKEIVVISGKGGTGKTSITASFAFLGGGDIVVADCDVDASDLHLLMNPDFATSEEFMSGELAVINQSRCSQCGKCAEVCRFDAVDIADGQFVVDPVRCEGCGYCARICPEEAIRMEEQKAGEVYISTAKTNGPMVHARLGITAENSGKLVAKVKNEARRIAEETGRGMVLVDGSPGIGCPVVSSLSGADYVILVTEPTVSGLHDLKRANEVRANFDVPAGCIINKSDLNTDISKQIANYLKEKSIRLVGEIPYDEDFTKAMTMGKTIIEYNNTTGRLIEGFWHQITHGL